MISLPVICRYEKNDKNWYSNENHYNNLILFYLSLILRNSRYIVTEIYYLLLSFFSSTKLYFDGRKIHHFFQLIFIYFVLHPFLIIIQSQHFDFLILMKFASMITSTVTFLLLCLQSITYVVVTTF